MGRVVSLGSLNVDLVREVSESEVAVLEARHEWFPGPGETAKVDELPAGFGAEYDRIHHGGKGANQAVAAARAGAETAMLGKVGPDHAEFGVLSELADDGVDVGGVAVGSEPTGTAYVFVDAGGENRIVVRPGANGTVDGTYVRAHSEAVRAADCLLIQNEIPVEPVAELLATLADEPRRPTVILDPAPPDGAEALLGSDAVDYVTPNEAEYEALSADLAAFDGVVVRKQGADDVVVEADPPFAVTPPAVRVVETTGAGDTLNGFLAAQLAAGASLREAVEVGVVAGSLSTRAAGTRQSIPTMAEVRAFRADR